MHLLRFVLSLALKGLRKFRVSKIKNEMRETGVWVPRNSPQPPRPWALGIGPRDFMLLFYLH